MSEWQDISTAPKDGTWIDLWRGEAKAGTWSPRVSAKWDDGLQAWVWPAGIYDPWHRKSDCDHDIEYDCYEDAENFTHWMPLPEPPK